MGLLAAIGGGAFVLASLLVSIRLLALARRTRQFPELLIGIGLLLMGAVGYPVSMAARMVKDDSLETTLFVIHALIMLFGQGGIVLFKALTEPEIERIVELMLNDLRARLADRRMALIVSDDARRFIARQGFDPVYGARPLRRFIAHEVETRIARALLRGDVPDGSEIHVELFDELTVTYRTPPDEAAA